MGNVVDTVIDVVANVATGGLYSVGKAALSDHPFQALLTQGLDLGMAATGNSLAVDLGGPIAGQAFNAAGGIIGAAGAAGAFSGLPGFAPGGGVAPLAAGAPSATPALAGEGMGTMPDASGIIAGANAPAAAPGTGMISSTPGALAPETAGYVPTSMAAPETVGYVDALKNAATTLETTSNTAGWFASQPAAVKAALLGGGVFAGGQLMTGALGGIFAGVSAQKKLELEQLINQERQNQVTYLNKNQTYAPKLMFRQPKGMIAAGKV
jgi:hypothetical protein